MDAETLINTLVKVKNEARVDALADTVAEKKGQTLINTLGKLKAEALVGALDCKLAEVKAETLSDTLYKVKDLALIDTLADWPTEVVPEKKFNSGRGDGRGKSR